MDPWDQRRRSVRRPEHDYAGASWYFVTLLASRRQRLFGEIEGGVFRANPIGEIVRAEWERSEQMREELTLDEYVIMPDHMHGIVKMAHRHVDGPEPLDPVLRLCRAPRSLGSFIAGFKAATTRRINLAWGTEDDIVWHRNYFESIIASHADLLRIRAYVRNNPRAWRGG